MWNNAPNEHDHGDPDVTITAAMAAEIMGVSPKTVKRLFRKGKLPGKATRDGIVFRRWDALLYREWRNNRNLMDGVIKTAYVFDQMGCLKHANYSWVSESFDEIMGGLRVYRFEREGIINPLGVNPDSVFLVDEVRARLGLNDSHVVYGMLEDGVIKPQEGFVKECRGRTDGNRMMVDAGSFREYLDPDVSERFFRSSYLAEEVGKPIMWVNRKIKNINDARMQKDEYPIGRKINSKRKNSAYLYTLGDVCQFADVCSVYGGNRTIY